MHPHSHMIILAPNNNVGGNNSETTTDDNNEHHPQTQPATTVVQFNLIIGANNLFEERCRVEIDLTNHIQKLDLQRHDNVVDVTIIGNGNVFSAMSKVQCQTSIGDYNVFGAASQVHVHRVRNGCNFAPNLRYSCLDCYATSGGVDAGLDHQVVFRLCCCCSNDKGNVNDLGDDYKGICLRDHLDGAARNKEDVLAYIAAMAGIVKKHHKLME